MSRAWRASTQVSLFLACMWCGLHECELSSAHHRPTYCPTWNPFTLPCPLAEDAVQRLEAKLDANLAGQNLARRTIEKALSTNIQRHSNFTKEAWNPYYVESLRSIASSVYSSAMPAGKSVPRPLFMHFSGPTGVGKSITADIIADAILKEQNAERQLCGKLLLQMNQYSSRNPKHIHDHSLRIYNMVAEQLHHCPRSVLIFDEIQRAPEELLDNIIDIFDNSGRPLILPRANNQTVNTSMCIVIVISDIGSTKLKPDMNRDAAKQAIEEDADSKFKNSKKRALLQNIVPFLPLSREDLKWVAIKELKDLGGALALEYRGVWGGKLTWHKDVPHWMASKCHAEAACVEDGGRGVDTMVEHDIAGLAEGALDEECSRSPAVSFNNVDLQVAEDQSRIVARIDEVYNKTEFREL